MLRRLFVLFMAMIVAVGAIQLGVAAPASHLANHGAQAFPSSSYCADSEDMAFLAQINSYRAQNGLGPLALSQKLADSSYYHSNDMATKNYFSHTLAGGTTWDQNIHNFGYTYNTYIGENIAAGYSTGATVFTAWKNSPPHNTNMLSPNYSAIGIARAYSSSSEYGWYWTTDFGGVVDAAGAVCSASPSPTPSNTVTSSPIATKTFTPQATATKTATTVPTATKTATPKTTATKTPTPEATATNTATATKTAIPKATATKTSTPAPTATKTAAASISSYVSNMSSRWTTSRGATTISVVATIKDARGRYVSGAGVTIALTAPGGSSQSLTVTTDRLGQAEASFDAADGKGIYTATVTDVSFDSRPYDSSQNRTGSITVTVQ